jgi:nucleotide-binding universal stress UspA family protein
MGIIVCATDFSKESTAVVSTAAAFSRLFGSSLELFHLFEAPAAFSPDVLDQAEVDELRASAEKASAIQAEALRAGGLDVRTSVEYGAPGDISRHARSVGADLLVVGTHGRQGAAHLFFGSVAERTIRTTPCPIVGGPFLGDRAPGRGAGGNGAEDRGRHRLLACQRSGNTGARPDGAGRD